MENIVGEQPEYIIWKKGNRMLNYDTERGGIRCLALASNLSQHKLSFLGFVFVLISCSRVSLTSYWHLVPACLCLCLDILFQTVFNFVLTSCSSVRTDLLASGAQSRLHIAGAGLSSRYHHRNIIIMILILKSHAEMIDMLHISALCRYLAALHKTYYM